MSKKRVIFMGTPDFSATVLKALVQSAYQVVMVVTQPDRPKGRGMHLGLSATKQAAQQLGIETIYQPEKLRSAQSQAPILACEADYIITAAFGQLLPDRILQHAKVAAINLHASLLPAYRGSAPIHRAMLNGDQVTGVSTMLMVHAMDAGDVLLQQSCAIEASDTVGSLYEKLAQIGAKLLLETLDRYENNTITAHPQDESKVTYAAAITAADQKINWQQSAEQIFNRIRGLNPEPGAFCLFRGKNMKLWQSSLTVESTAAQPAAAQPSLAQPSSPQSTEVQPVVAQRTVAQPTAPQSAAAQPAAAQPAAAQPTAAQPAAAQPNSPQPAAPLPGEILQSDQHGLLVQCGSGRLRLTEIQPAGKNKMAAAAFIRGNKVIQGELLH